MDWTQFESQMTSVLTDFNLAGAGIAVVRGGNTVYARGFGFRDVAEEKPMTPDSLFAIGSTTKAMTTTVMGMLVDEGKLAWDAPVREYLPWFNLSDPDISRRITVRDLVTHRSGLPRH
nr:serine hydrolase domain-containing protein [bacterium]